MKISPWGSYEVGKAAREFCGTQPEHGCRCNCGDWACAAPPRGKWGYRVGLQENCAVCAWDRGERPPHDYPADLAHGAAVLARDRSNDGASMITHPDCRLKWGSNRKLAKTNTLNFGIPAYESADGTRTCPGAGACAAVCYARQGFYGTHRVKRLREHNLAMARGDLGVFVDAVVHDLALLSRFRSVRVHDDGDFFSQDYLEAWFTAAESVPDRRFYAYTKSLHLKLWDEKPDNFTLIQSEGGVYDHLIDWSKPVSRIFATLEAMRADGWPEGWETDQLAIDGAPRIGLLYHGSRGLTASQSTYFGRRESCRTT